MTPLDMALEYAARGWRVFPLPHGAKVPRLKQWQERATTDHAQIEAWWTQKPDAGVAIATGAKSGIWVLDVDVADGKAGDDTLAELCARHGELPPTRTSITGSGGVHYLFSWPDDVEIRNSAGTRLGPGLDVRGDGGFIVAPPSTHPNGQTYEWDIGEPDEPADAPQWLLELVRPPEPEAVRAVTDSERRTDRPGDQWAAAITWPELLEPDGWTLSHIDRQGEHHWVRPGKDPRDGTSATTGYTAADTLKVFTSSMQHWNLGLEGTYSKLGYLAATRFGGDDPEGLSAAATWCREQGFGDDTPELDDLFERTAPPPPPEVDPVEPEPAKELRPLEERRQLPPWPIDVLPDWMANHVRATAERLRTPIDLPAQFALGALSAVCMGNATVKVPAVGWSEPVNLYLWCAMPSGAGKSPTEKAITGPLLEWERQRCEDSADDYKIRRAEWRVLQKQAKEAEQAAVMGSHPDAKGMLIDAVVAANVPEPKPFRLTADDATPQVLVQLLGHHHRLAVISAEGGLFDMVTAQFGKTSGGANVDVYLKAWSGDTIQRDRVGGDAGAESVRIDHPLLTMSLAMQPSVIERYQATSPELRGRGFFARFMPSIPAVVEGPGGLLDGGAPDEEAQRRYSDGLTHVADALVGGEAVELALNAEATSIFAEWHDRCEVLTRAGQRLRPLAEMMPKIRSSVLRTAGLLALADDQSLTIDADTMRRAIRLGDYWTAHALEMERTSDPLDQLDAKDLVAARRILDWAMRRYCDRGIVEFSPKDIMRGPGRSMADVYVTDDLVPAIAVLADNGWLKFTEGNLEGVGVRRTPVRMALSESAILDPGRVPNDVPNSAQWLPDGDPAGTNSDLWAHNVPITLRGEKEMNLSFSTHTHGRRQEDAPMGTLGAHSDDTVGSPEIHAEINEWF